MREQRVQLEIGNGLVCFAKDTNEFLLVYRKQQEEELEELKKDMNIRYIW